MWISTVPVGRGGGEVRSLSGCSNISVVNSGTGRSSGG